MNTESNGKIDKYNLAVFFLKLASYEHLVRGSWIESDMGFRAEYQTPDSDI